MLCWADFYRKYSVAFPLTECVLVNMHIHIGRDIHPPCVYVYVVTDLGHSRRSTRDGSYSSAVSIGTACDRPFSDR